MPLKTFAECEKLAEAAHGILGLRMALYGVRLLGLMNPVGADRKRLITQRARELYPEILDKNQQHMHAYRQPSDEELLERQWLRVSIGVEDLPGYKAARVMCAQCGEGINFKREVVREGRTLCRACAGERYYEPLG